MLASEMLTAVIKAYTEQKDIRVEMIDVFGNVIRVFGKLEDIDLYDGYIQIMLDGQSEIHIATGKNVAYDELEGCYEIKTETASIYLYL